MGQPKELAPTLPLRIQLPRGITAILRCEANITIERVVERAVDRVKEIYAESTLAHVLAAASENKGAKQGPFSLRLVAKNELHGNTLRGGSNKADLGNTASSSSVNSNGSSASLDQQAISLSLNELDQTLNSIQESLNADLKRPIPKPRKPPPPLPESDQLEKVGNSSNVQYHNAQEDESMDVVEKQLPVELSSAYLTNTSSPVAPNGVNSGNSGNFLPGSPAMHSRSNRFSTLGRSLSVEHNTGLGSSEARKMRTTGLSSRETFSKQSSSGSINDPNRPTTASLLNTNLTNISKNGVPSFGDLTIELMESDTNLMFRPSSLHGSHAPTFNLDAIITLPNKATMNIKIPCDVPIAHLKEAIWNSEELKVCCPGLSSPEDYSLKYFNEDGQIVELFEEQQILQTVSILRYWQNAGMPISFFLLSRERDLSKAAKNVNKKIGSLIGYGLYRFNDSKDAEVDTFRRKMVRVRHEAVRERDPFLYSIRPNVDLSPPTELIRSYLARSKIQIRMRVKFVEHNIDMVKTLTCNGDDTPDVILANFLPKNKLNLPPDAKPDDFYIKVCGMADYLTGGYKMIDFKCIRNAILKDQRINLTLVYKNSVPVDESKELLEEFDLIEDLSGHSGTHEQLTVEGRDLSKIRCISLWDVTRFYRVMVVAGENLNFGNVESLYVEAGLFHGGQPISAPRKSCQVKVSRNPRWNNWLIFDIPTCNIPRNARLCLTIFGRWNAKKKMEHDKDNDIYPLGWVNFVLVDYKGYLRTGLFKLHLWPGERANPIGTCVSPRDSEDMALFIRLESYRHPVIFPKEEWVDEYKEKFNHLPPPSSDAEAKALEAIITSDPLTKLTEEHQRLVWNYRHHLIRRPEALPKVLLAAKWSQLEHVIEVKRMLKSWAPMAPEAALELLDSNFGDEDVRAYAVSRLEQLSDDVVLDFLLQLVQVIKYEPYHDSALARFLLKRALKNRIVGHHFFWYLKSEIKEPEISLRFALLLEAYLRGCSHHMDELLKQADILDKLCDMANAVKQKKSASEKTETLKGRLAMLNLTHSFQLPLNPRIELKNVVSEKFKYMDSKKLPLWCVFENADPTGDSNYILFKTGDDLRQDMLTLQMIQIMDKLWQQNNLYLRMLPYGCISMGHEVGMIEIVLNASTVSKIQLEYGGTTAAFKDQPLNDWIRAQNPDDKDYEAAVETFTLSCAGYCVATYVLGIGDRHNDNIMVTKSGHLFHIDFGHFLGNIKRKFGIKRERAPFVFTPDFAYVMGKKEGEQFKRFVEYCQQAYLILRRHANMFINLFAMMLSTGIPELKAVEDIYYLRDALCLGMTEEAAAAEFKNLIFESLRLGWSTQLNWYVHNVMHAK